MPDWYGKGKDENDSLDAKRKKLPFQSRRSPILCRNGCVATSQPLASTIGLNILQSGGNALPGKSRNPNAGTSTL